MRENWDRRAIRDAFYYVETAHWDGDVDEFFALGEERTQLLVDPVLAELGRPPGHESALDLGCGVGRFSRAFARRFRDVLGVDVSTEMVKKARDLHPPAAYANLRFEATDGVTLPAEDRSHAFVFSYEVFQHMPTEAVIRSNLSEIARVLRADGVALVHVKTGDEGRRDALARLVPEAALRAIKRASRRDVLASDPTFRGAPPLPRARLEELFEDAGLTVSELREDPTHAAGTRAFVVASPTNSA
jgi:SAM-dependent methyltransferase